MIKIKTIKEFETNKNAVLFHYSCPCPTDGERPIGCCVRFLDYTISASVFDHYFAVYKGCCDKLRIFYSLKDAKNFIISHFDNCLKF